MKDAAATLVGVWRLESFKRRFSDTGETVDVLGPAPEGVLVLLPEGRMTALLTASERRAGEAPEALFASMMAYSGEYTLEADRFLTDVDVAWHPSWVGSRQVRFFEVDGDRLCVTTAEQTHPAYPGRLGRGILTWRRERDRAAR